MERTKGFEPSTLALARRCSTSEPRPRNRFAVFETSVFSDNQPFGRFKEWSGRRDSNPRPSPWQGDALPLSHVRKLAGDLGFEPRNDGVKVRCLTAWLIPKDCLWGDRWDSNPRMPEPQSGALTTSPRPPYLVVPYWQGQQESNPH